MLTISSSRLILLCSFVFLFFNYIFFKNAFSFAVMPQDLVFMLTIPIVLFLMFCMALSILFVPYLTKFIAVILIMISAVGSYFMNEYGVIIDSSMIQNAIQTDTKEISDLLNFRMVFWILFFGVLPSLLIILAKIKYKKPLKELFGRVLIIVSSLAIIGVVYLGLSKFYIPFFRDHNELRTNLVPSYPIYQAVKLYKKTNKKPLVIASIGDDAKIRGHNEKKIFVMIVGETERSANYSLNGYSTHDTNQYTKQLNSIVSFSKFYSCGTSTAVSLPCMFSNLTRENYDSNVAQSRENVVDVIQRVGVLVYWLDNNSGFCKGVCERVKNIRDYGGTGFDSVIFDEAKTLVENADKTTLIVLHIQGSHGPTYYKRYPKEFKKFTPTCDTSKLQDCSHEDIVNTYDNSILYIDYQMSKLIHSLQEKSKNSDFKTALFFVSDHGESLGENGLYLHGMPYAIAPDTQKHVPAIFWLSDSQLANKLALKKDEPFSHDYLFNTLLGYFDINSAIYNPNLDILK